VKKENGRGVNINWGKKEKESTEGRSREARAEVGLIIPWFC